MGRDAPLSAGRFAAYAAHELRAPVALQRALVEVTLADPNADAAALRAMGERVIASCVRQQRLIDALLALVGGHGDPRREPVDIAAIAAGALSAHDLSGLDSVVALEPVWTAGDPDLLERLAGNLVSNAVRHNTAGGRIEVETRAEPGRAVLSIANTPGPVPAAGGNGLGLSLVDEIAGAHGATVRARVRTGGLLGIDVVFAALDREERTW